MSTIKLRRSAVPSRVPTTAQLDLGEVAINTHDGVMFFKQDDTASGGGQSIVEVGRPDTAANVFYVKEDGDDDRDGTTIAGAFATLNEAMTVASSGDTIFLKSGDHTILNNPLEIPAGVSIIGDNLRSTTIRPSNATNDILHLNNATYISGVTFRGHTIGAAAVAFPTAGAGVITTSPYVQNCSSITSDGVGMKIDGSRATGTRSMVSDAFTQINLGGTGVHILNRGYAQLVSIFTVACQDGILCESGGQCSLTNSNASFGTFGLRATGKSASLYTGSTTTNIVSTANTVTVGSLTTRPKYGDAIKFDGDTRYYTVNASTALNAGTSDVTILETFDVDLASGAGVNFYERSLIQASSITFEYVGSGNNFTSALPENGGVPIQANEVIEDADGQGQVFFTSTDQLGDFRIGGELLINASAGIIEGTTFDRSLFAVLTPYILAIES
jgi:hypothetical protein